MTWTDVITFDQLPIDRGVAAMVDGRAIALFRLDDGSVHAIDHVEPFTGVPVLARGLVGSSDGVPTVASPLHKQRFDLRTGVCLDAEATVESFPVIVVDGTVRIAPSGSTVSSKQFPKEHHLVTPHQITLVRDSFEQVAPIAETAATLFYGRLFDIAPETKPLFTGDMAAQGRALMATLGTVARRLDDLDGLLPSVTELAKRHVGYGVTAAHYQHVGAALLWTLEQGLSDAYTPEVAEAWATAYGLLSSAMIAAAYGPSDAQMAS